VTLAMTPATSTEAEVDLSGRASTPESPPFTTKYGESVLSVGGAAWARAAKGWTARATRTSAVGRGLGWAMPSPIAWRLPARRGPPTARRAKGFGGARRGRGQGAAERRVRERTDEPA